VLYVTYLLTTYLILPARVKCILTRSFQITYLYPENLWESLRPYNYSRYYYYY